MPLIAAPVRGGDAAGRLARALVLLASEAGLSVGVEDVRPRAWASATFSGTQVTLVLVAPRAPTLGRWLCDLPEAEVAIRGHLLASVALDRIEDDGEVMRTEVTALVIEE